MVGRPSLLLLLAMGAELLFWAVSRSNSTATFAWFRVLAHAGWAGFLLVLFLGIASAAAAWLKAGGFRPCTRRRRESSRPLRSARDEGTSRLFPDAFFGAAHGTLEHRDVAAWEWGLLLLAAMGLHLFFTDIAQGQPDTANYFVLAQRFAREPLATLLAWPSTQWSDPQADFHLLFPMVPMLYGLAFRLLGESPSVADAVMGLFAVALPFSVALLGSVAGDQRRGLRGAWLILSLPYLQAQSGWMLVDLPLVLFLTLALALGMASSRNWRSCLRATAGLVAIFTISTKITAWLFMLVAVAAMRCRRFLGRSTWLIALVSLVLLALFQHYRTHRDPGTWVAALWGVVLHTRPSLWVLAIPAMLAWERWGRTLATTAWVVLVLIIVTPADHAARYALPVVPFLCLAAARVIAGRPGVLPGLVVSGITLALVGYRPILIHNQAVNIKVAAERMDALGVSSIEVWTDSPGSAFSPAAIVALVDYYSKATVWLGGALSFPRSEGKSHWWEYYEPPPWHMATSHPETAEGIMLCLYAADSSRFEAGPGRGRSRLGSISLYQASSWLLPREVVLYGGRDRF